MVTGVLRFMANRKWLWMSTRRFAYVYDFEYVLSMHVRLLWSHVHIMSCHVCRARLWTALPHWFRAFSAHHSERDMFCRRIGRDIYWRIGLWFSLWRTRTLVTVFKYGTWDIYSDCSMVSVVMCFWFGFITTAALGNAELQSAVGLSQCSRYSLNYMWLIAN